MIKVLKSLKKIIQISKHKNWIYNLNVLYCIYHDIIKNNIHTFFKVFRRTIPQPSPLPYPFALFEKGLLVPSGEIILALLSATKTRGSRIQLTPPQSAISQSPNGKKKHVLNQEDKKKKTFYNVYKAYFMTTGYLHSL